MRLREGGQLTHRAVLAGLGQPDRAHRREQALVRVHDGGRHPRGSRRVRDGHRIVGVVPVVRGRAGRITGAGLRRVADDRRAEVVRGQPGVVGVEENPDGAQPPDVLHGDLGRHAPVHQGGYRPEPGQRQEVEYDVGR